MKILYVTSEAAPFAASGGLGDVMGALPQAVQAALPQGSEVSVILPLYRKVPEDWKKKMFVVTDLCFMLAWRRTGCRVWGLLQGGVTYYFIENNYYFDRPALYGEYDDGERFAFFGKAVMEFIRNTDRVPDILHANDWQAALPVIYAKTKYREDRRLIGMKTVYTIHNIEYQGKYDAGTLWDLFELPGEAFPAVEFDGCINLAKGAIVLCDRLTTVSPNYAKELCEPYFAYGLADILRQNAYKMTGIINGIDTQLYNPSYGDLPVSYDKTTFRTGKVADKAALQKELGLPEKPDTPLLAMVTRLTAGKGMELVLRILDELLEMDVQFVLLGTGDGMYECAFADLCSRHGDRARALIRFDRGLSRRIYAGADLFLMPSKTEPCGLSQMIACAYGTVPVVRDVGGLHDSIRSVGEEGGFGFKFTNFNAHELLFRVKDALALYHNKPEWEKTVTCAMEADFTWAASANKYIRFYQG